MGDLYGKLAASRPVNRSASVVTAKGTHFIPAVPLRETVKHWKACPAFKEHPSSPGFTDLTGARVGQVVVVGYYGPTRTGAIWVVRCVCGDYELRKAGSIRRMRVEGDAEHSDHCCVECDYTRRLRKGFIPDIDINNRNDQEWSSPDAPDPSQRRTNKHGLPSAKRLRWKECPSLQVTPNNPDNGVVPGLVAGRLTIMGYFGPGRKGALWVVKCVCGIYEVRYSRSLLGGSEKASCRTCANTNLAKNPRISPEVEMPERVSMLAERFRR